MNNVERTPHVTVTSGSCRAAKSIPMQIRTGGDKTITRKAPLAPDETTARGRPPRVADAMWRASADRETNTMVW